MRKDEGYPKANSPPSGHKASTYCERRRSWPICGLEGFQAPHAAFANFLCRSNQLSLVLFRRTEWCHDEKKPVIANSSYSAALESSFSSRRCRAALTLNSTKGLVSTTGTIPPNFIASYTC